MTDGPPCDTWKPWRRQANGVGVGAEFVCRPKRPKLPEHAVRDIIRIIKWAEDNDRTVRALGVGHSYSDVVDTTGIIVDMSEISGVVGDIDDSHINDADKPHAFVTVQAGTSIKNINTALRDHEPPLALEIMGSYDAQHIAGAVSTGTHGSGRKFGPIESQVVALKIVTAGRKVRTLRRDDADQKKRQEFLAAVISMGCAGIITEMTLRVVPAYELFEERLLKKWKGIRKAIASGSFHDDWQHAEVALDPYPLDDETKRTCLVTKRRLPKNEDQGSKRERTGCASRIAGHSKLFKRFLAREMGNPKKAAKFVRKTLKGLAHKGYRHDSDKVL